MIKLKRAYEPATGDDGARFYAARDAARNGAVALKAFLDRQL